MKTILTFFVLCLTASASTLPYKSVVDPSDYSGILHMSGTGDWYAGTYLKYTITQNPNDPDGTPNFKYDYYFIEYGSTPFDGVNAMLLEFSLSCDTDPACFRDDPHPYQPGDIAHLPAGINAAEWDADNADNRGVYGFHFLSDRTPVWGNFFAVGADYNAWSYNPGLMNPDSTNKLDFIPRPDGDVQSAASAVPEPAEGAMLFFGIALIVVSKRAMTWGRSRSPAIS